MESVQWIEQHGKTARGKRELLKYLNKETLTLRQAVLACCYLCTGYFDEGRLDCEIDYCPLHPFMIYRRDKKKVERVLSEKQKQAVEKMRSFRSGTCSFTRKNYEAA